MTLTLDLTLELENQLRQEAAREGLDETGYVLKALKERFLALRARASQPETELLARINEGLPEVTWRRYRELVAKRQAEELTPEQHAELMALTHRIEETHARRLEALGELSRLRGTSLETLMQELGIKFPPDA